MARFSSSGLTYPEAQSLVVKLNQLGKEKDDIAANITAGGIAIHVDDPNRIQEVANICKQAGASFSGGFTESQENVLMKSQNGYEVAKQVTTAAYQAWHRDL